MCFRYKDNTTEDQDVVQWLWQTLEDFSKEEKILFLRFVSGRSRLPHKISDIPQRFVLSVYDQVLLVLTTNKIELHSLIVLHYFLVHSQMTVFQQLKPVTSSYASQITHLKKC